MWLNKTDNSIIAKPKGITVGGIDYPSAIFSKYSEAELNAISIFTITEDAIPNRRYYTYNEVLDTATSHITRTPISRPVADIQAVMLQDLEDVANSKFEATTAGYTAGEMSSWSELEADAIAHQTTPLTSGMLYDEATIAGITVDELANRVLTKATAFKQAKAYISGMKKKKSLEIQALATIDDCILYEATPYEYTYTVDDLEVIDGLKSAGDIVTRYKNNVKEW